MSILRLCWRTAELTERRCLRSGCSTLLKTIAGETHGFYLEEGSNLQYQGIPASTMHSDFRGEVSWSD